MPKRMLIDASHPEETRVVVLDGNRVEEFDFEAASKRPLKGNIYLAKVTRVEPSLQAAFVEYGGNRQGFLAFSEIHPDYYQIPVADRIALLEAQTQRLMADEDEGIDQVDIASVPAQEAMLGSEHADEQAAEHFDTQPPRLEEGENPEAGGDNENANTDSQGFSDQAAEGQTELSEISDSPSEDSQKPEGESRPSEAPVASETLPSAPVLAESTGAPQAFRRRDRPRPPRRRQYKIQEVIKRRQIMLVQVVKEERGNKGASLTTFLSLAGRYCVLMPNTPRGGGISRKITSATDRKRLKSAAQSLELPEGMGLIIRTAGANRTKLEIKRDYEYLLRLWDTVRELTLKSNAPALVYEEGSLIKRAIRDLYNKDTADILVDGEAGYRDAKDFMRMLMPSHAKNVKPYKEALPLFQRYQVESQLDAMFSPVVTLRSGGYVVINQTEALVSIDVNSGKATREHSIEETAHKTNLEAADEIARQLRLRDLAGLIVIDFIDMEDSKNDRNVEKRLHNAVRGDRARIQIGKISQFGLLEMSRQRLRAGVVAGSTVTCPHCNGQGIIRSTESAALRLLRALDEEGQRGPGVNLTVKAPPDVTIYTLNQKRREIARIEEAYNLAISFDPQSTMMGGSFELERTGVRAPITRPKSAAISVEAGFEASVTSVVETEVEIVEPPAEVQLESARDPAPVVPAPAIQVGNDSESPGGHRRRRRRRRGGRGRSGQHPHHEGASEPHSPEFHRGASQHIETRQDAAAGGQEFSRAAAVETVLESPRSEVAPGLAAQSPPSGGRRRRRRGRRGRRREGEFGNGGGDKSSAPQLERDPAQASEVEHGDAPPQDSQVEHRGREVVEPNAPSSPQWSLAEHRAEAETAARELARPRADESKAPDVDRADEAPVSAPSEADSDELREARKGWWQRRFKI
jgi:ribonuclease E